MNDTLAPLAHWIDSLQHALTPPQRRVLMRSIAAQLRIKNRNRIKRNIDPEGHPFVPRKREQIKKIRRGLMFKRLNPQMQTDSSADHAAIGFSGRLGQKMIVHQFGMTQNPTPRAKPYHYPRRELVGFSPDDVAMIDTIITDFLVKSTTK